MPHPYDGILYSWILFENISKIRKYVLKDAKMGAEYKVFAFICINILLEPSQEQYHQYLQGRVSWMSGRKG